jgi:hypothetical protein
MLAELQGHKKVSLCLMNFNLVWRFNTKSNCVVDDSLECRIGFQGCCFRGTWGDSS